MNNSKLPTPQWMVCAVFCALFAPTLAGAADWNIDPVRIELSKDTQMAAITLKNASDQPTSIQVEVVAWTQKDGKDIYTASRELLISPPIVTIPGKSEQIIRAALRREADPSQELSYRINLQELPPAPTPGLTGVQVALRIGLPVFVQPQKNGALPKMLWNCKRMPDNTLKVVLHNQGNVHVQVTDFSLNLPGKDQVVAGESGSSYVLAGQTREWLLKPSAAQIGSHLRLKAFTDAGNIDTELALGKP